MKIGLYFGSFNPVHIGHLIVADSMLNAVGLDAVWLVVSPQNPFKSNDTLAPEADRLRMAELAAMTHERISVCAIEFDLPKPSYTINTLNVLGSEYPDDEFHLIMGMDNLAGFRKWKDWPEILERVQVQVYDRQTDADIAEELSGNERIHIHRFPLINVSSTRLRKQVSEGGSIRYWVLREIEDYIWAQGLYQPTGDQRL